MDCRKLQQILAVRVDDCIRFGTAIGSWARSMDIVHRDAADAAITAAGRVFTAEIIKNVVEAVDLPAG